MTYTDFLRLFPNNNACMDYLRDRFYPDGSDCPSCGKTTKFHRIRGRSAYACQYCRHQVYPTAGTVFHKSTTNLQLWFWAIFLMSSTRCGISAKQLEREIGVTYKTAHRMFKQIRSLLADDDGEPPLSGEVEMDETYVGGKDRAGRGRTGRPGKSSQKVPVFGMVERGGRVKATVVFDASAPSLRAAVGTRVLPEAMIFTDEWKSYGPIGREYRAHYRVRHSANIYVEGDVHTNTIEGFFGVLKNGIRGVYHAVSRDYLQSYLDEYAWRYNHRQDAQPMFWSVLDRVHQIQRAA
jgi:transposase-like protein